MLLWSRGIRRLWYKRNLAGTVLPQRKRLPPTLRMSPSRAGTSLLPTEKVGANSEDVYVQENVGRAQ